MPTQIKINPELTDEEIRDMPIPKMLAHFRLNGTKRWRSVQNTGPNKAVVKGLDKVIAKIRDDYLLTGSPNQGANILSAVTALHSHVSSKGYFNLATADPDKVIKIAKSRVASKQSGNNGRRSGRTPSGLS